MEEKKKKLNLKIVIPVVVAIAIIAIIGIVVITSGNKGTGEQKQGTSQTTEELTADEQFAVDYLVTFADAPMFNNRHSIKIHKVWFYNDGIEGSEKFAEDYYVAYNITYQDRDGIEVEETFGNTLGVSNNGQTTIEDAYKSYLVLGTNMLTSSKYDQNNYWNTKNLKAKERGTLLDTDKIQKAFEEAL